MPAPACEHEKRRQKGGDFSESSGLVHGGVRRPRSRRRRARRFLWKTSMGCAPVILYLSEKSTVGVDCTPAFRAST